MAHDVFISHSSQDKPVADAAVAALEAAGIRCWIAPRVIIPGSNYMRSISEALHSSSAVVLIFSEAANTSRHVSREIQQAVEHGLPILPLRLDNITPGDSLSYALVGTHWLDVLSLPLEENLSRLTAAAQVFVGTARVSPSAESLVFRNGQEGRVASRHIPDAHVTANQRQAPGPTATGGGCGRHSPSACSASYPSGWRSCAPPRGTWRSPRPRSR